MSWLDDEIAALRGEFNQRRFYFAFSGVSRRFDKRRRVSVAEADLAILQGLGPGISVEGWDEFRLARVVLLLVLAEQPDTVYQETLGKVLGSADLREQVAIYSAIPLLPEPGFLVGLAREASRTNIVDVFDAIALDNPFPAAHFPEEAWNQLVLKSLFINRPLYRMMGIDERANATLAEMLSNLAHERWAAGRPVSPELWRGCVNFVTDTLAEDIARVAASDEPGQREAAALVVAADTQGVLVGLRDALADELEAIRTGTLDWNRLGERLANS